MVSLDTVQPTASSTIEIASSPRISFSAEFLDDDDADDFISICPNSPLREISTKDDGHRQKPPRNAADHFEFLSGDNNGLQGQRIITADELFFEGKLLPFWHAHNADRLNKISLKISDDNKGGGESDARDRSAIKESLDDGAGNRPTNTWFVDDDPSPRPPKCTVLWKELLRLKKQRAASTLSPSSSSSSSSSSASSMADVASADEGNGRNQKNSTHLKGIRKGLERTRSATIRIRPMINVPICTQVKSSTAGSRSSLPPLFPLKKGKLVR